MQESRDTTESVFRFIKETVLYDLYLEDLARRCEFAISSREYFNAFISFDKPARKPRYFIELTKVIGDRIAAVLDTTKDATDTLSSLRAPSGTMGGFDDPNCLLSLIRVSSLGFILFHELGHAVAGHLRYWQKHHGNTSRTPSTFDEIGHFGFGVAEVQGQSLTQQQSIDRRIMELEADGLALELVHQFRREFATLVMPEDTNKVLLQSDMTDETIELVLERTTLAGTLLSVALLENERARLQEQRAASHPFPEARLFNLLMRPIAITLGDKRRIVEGEERVSYSDPLAREATMHVLRQVVAPTLGFLFEVARLSSVEIPGTALLITKNFLTDVKTLVTEGTALTTLGGQEIAMLNDYKSQYIQRLAAYRDVDWWENRG